MLCAFIVYRLHIVVLCITFKCRNKENENILGTLTLVDKLEILTKIENCDKLVNLAIRQRTITHFTALDSFTTSIKWAEENGVDALDILATIGKSKHDFKQKIR